jgi:hypothetical protein
MNTPRRALVLLIACSLLSLARAAHPFFCTDSYGNKVSLVAADGTVEWQYNAQHPQDCWVLPNGNFLFCHKGGAIELNHAKEIVWEYKADPKTEVHACQPLPDGRVLVVENGPCRILEIDRAGKIAKEIKLSVPPEAIKIHDQFRGTRKLANGHYLLCRKGEHQIAELDSEGKVLRSIPVDGDVHEALILPDGHMLVALGEGHAVVEYDAAMKVVWSLKGDEVPGNPLQLMTGFQRLPNGNTIFCNYLGHGQLGKQPHLFEITRDKKVVWEFADHKNFKTINQIQVLDVKGDATKGEILR